MHHLYPLAKGDPLCPLGFHPQVRWPTRCKRCFRDYKEHGGKKRDSDTNLKKDASTVSTPSLSWSSGDLESKRSWVSSSNISTEEAVRNDNNDFGSVPSSWISTPDLANMKDDTQPVTTVNITLPKRKQKQIESNQRTVSDSFSVVKNKSTVFSKNDSLATRAKKLQAIKESTPERGKRIQIKEVKTVSDESSNNDVQFVIQVKTKPSNESHYSSHEGSDDDTISLAGTDTTDTTLVNSLDNELRDQLESLKRELDTTKSKCERLEREKSDILLRRLAAMETTTSKTAASEVLKLQQKCNEFQQQLEDLRDDKKSLSLKVKELEEDLANRPTPQQTQELADGLRSKLLAAETLCEELMDENEDIKKELRDMEVQMDELQDNFRDDQAIAYTSLKKDLDQTTKNCRILSFKLRKAERKAVQLETEKHDLEKQLKDISGSGTTLNQIERNKQLEHELKLANEVSLRLQKELEEAREKISKVEDNKGTIKKKAPLLGSIGKSPSAEGKKVSRESLTRGGSQDDPAQLLRDLQDSLEREADLREQLKFSEEEAQNLRKKVSRIEDENESLVLQVKKMASRARTRKLSPTNQRLTPEPQEKSDYTDDDDLTEVKLQLEITEQETSLLRNKVEELESDNHKLRNKVKDFQEQVAAAKPAAKRLIMGNDDENSLLTQKLKVLEDETNDIRKKLIEKERDCERLHAELSITQKKSKGMQKSKSLDLDQQALDLRRQLQVVEQEASVLRNKVQSLEMENEKLNTENKRLSLLRGAKTTKLDKNIDKYIDQIASLEIEVAEKNEKIQELEKTLNNTGTKMTELKGELKKFTQRSPKRVTSLTSKEQLKMMVEDLEKEITEIIFCIKLNENSKNKLEEEYSSKLQKVTNNLEDANKKYDSLKKEFEEEKNKFKKDLKLKEDAVIRNKESLSKAKDSLDKVNIEKNTLQEEIDKLSKENKKLSEEKNLLDEEIAKLKTTIKMSNTKQSELNTLTQRVETLKLSLENKDKEYKKIQEDHKKLLDETTSKSKKISELESQLSKYENKCKEGDQKLQEHMKNSENESTKYKKIIRTLETDQTKWEDDRKKITIQMETLQTKIKGLESSIEQKDKLVKQLEDSLAKEREIVSKTSLKVDELENREISKLKDALSKSKVHVSEIESKLEIANKSNINLEDKLSMSQLDNKNFKLENEKKLKQLEIDLQNEKKKLEVLKNTTEKESKNKELELGVLKDKIKKLERGSSSPDMKKLQQSIEKLETNLNKERQKYEDLTAKYEILEEEHVVTKAKLVMEKETLESQYKNLSQEMEKIGTELRTLRETYNNHQDKWIKEKLQLEEKLKEANRNSYNGSESNRQRLKALLEEKQSELEQLKKEYEVVHDQMEFMRRENDDLKRKLDDYEKVNKIQRNISADSTAMEKEISQLRLRLNNVEKGKKADLAELKMRYESQINVVNGELQSLQNQVLRFKREKDTYKHMLESAQKTIGELKQNPAAAKEGPKNYDELEESKHKVATLEQQISCMEDELSEARLECSRLKTELVSERSSWEVKLSELHSKVNELEEEKVLNSGRTKIVGLRTRMELAWQKEREEQQRLLQETATLARDLRQTLFEVERERDKERLEAKRKQEQFKKTAEEEQDENKKKITELQYDLLELRDAHAKLRTTNEKLRREKERFEKEREEHRLAVNGKKKADYEDLRKINALVEQMDTLKQLAPELFFSKDNEASYTPTPPRRTRSKSRETSPAFDRRETSLSPEEKQQQIQYMMQRLVHTTEDLRKIQILPDDDYERERLKRLGVNRRATSSEHEALPNPRYGVTRKPSVSSLKRKSISLEQTTQIEQKIWTNDNSMTSLNSLELHSDIETGRTRRDASLDSRLSNGSTQSEIGDKKKKKGIMGKLKKLTKSRSIDDQDPGTFSPTRALSSKTNSQTDSTEDTRGSRKDLKERITSIFKKSGSSSRSNSVERRHETSSTHRPLVRTESNGHLTPADSESARSGTKKS